MIKQASNLAASLMVMLTFTSALFGQRAPEVKPDVPEVLAWPAPPNPARIKWVAEYRSEFDVGAKKHRSFLDRLAGKADESQFMKRPLSVAADEGGVVFVGDFGLGVVGIDPANHRMWTFSSVAKMTLPTPAGIAVDSKFVYATDSNSNSLAVFDKEGHLLNSLGAEAGIRRPVGVAVDEAKDMLIGVNGGEHNLLVFTRNLKFVKKVGTRGGDPGQFNFPTYVCFIPGQGFAVTDTGNFRVQLFDYAGKFIKAFGKVGDGTGNFSRPKGVAADPDGNLYVVDAGFFNFQVFRVDGQVLTFVGQAGDGKGQFRIPCGISISKDGTIYVADEMNGRIQRFQYLPETVSQPGKP